jgi:hyperosmotically inducible protein
VGTQARDKAIIAKILKKFLNDDSIKVLDISVFCYEGHVYLVGEYESVKQKKQAVAIAKVIERVKFVTSYLFPKKNVKDCGMTDNLKILAKVEAALIQDREIWSTNVDVKTVQCSVILLGIVGSHEEIDKSIAHAKGVEGVRFVKSFLNVAKK